jgi:deoxyribonuclease-4
MVGLHVSAAGSPDLSFDRAEEVGATTFQIFTRNPNQWKFKPLPDETVSLFREKRKRSGIRRIADHMPYLPNLASPQKSIMKISRFTLDEEIKRCDALGIDFLVIHLGSHLGKGLAVGVRNIAEACNEAIAGSNGESMILLENMAGQQNSVGGRFEELRLILDKVKVEEKVGVCLDTCVPPGSQVMLDTNPVPIETVRVGDNVVGINGDLSMVTRLVRRPYTGDLVGIKPKGLPWISVTPEHPLLTVKLDSIQWLDKSPWRIKLTSNPVWVEASAIERGNYLVFPILKTGATDRIDFREHTSSHTRRLPFPSILPLGEEIAELFGLYLAEGYVFVGKGRRGGDNSKVYLSFGKHEKDLINRACILYDRVFSLKAWTDERETGICVVVGSNILARFLRKNFGGHAREKKIPEFIMKANDQLVRSFLLAYRKGDGYLNEFGIGFVTSSETVATQLVHLLARLDIRGVLRWHAPRHAEINGRLLMGHGWYDVHVGKADACKLGFKFHIPTTPQRTILRAGGSFLIPIWAITKSRYEGEVVNLTTESGSFLAPFVVTHNCHMFAAGFDLRSKEAVNGSMGLFEEVVGLDRLKAIHLNDSKGILGSKLDRHENIGEGKIGRKGIREFLHFHGVSERPLIMETPYDDHKTMEKSIKLVRTLLR